jgi:hypothetical protein
MRSKLSDYFRQHLGAFAMLHVRAWTSHVRRRINAEKSNMLTRQRYLKGNERSSYAGCTRLFDSRHPPGIMTCVRVPGSGFRVISFSCKEIPGNSSETPFPDLNLARNGPGSRCHPSQQLPSIIKSDPESWLEKPDAVYSLVFEPLPSVQKTSTLTNWSRSGQSYCVGVICSYRRM